MSRRPENPAAYRDLEDETMEAYRCTRLGDLRRVCDHLGLDLMELLGYPCGYCDGLEVVTVPTDSTRSELVRAKREKLGLTQDELDKRLFWNAGRSPRWNRTRAISTASARAPQ